MVGFFFGFHARLGRLHYILSWLAFASVMTLFCFAIAFATFRQAAPGEPPDSLFTLPVLCIVPVAFWMTVTLQSMRIRDIGWNPAYVIPAWLLLIGIDMVVAIAFPVLSVGTEHTETIFGALVNLGLTLALLFWPSSAADPYTAPRDFDDTRQARFVPSERVVTLAAGPQSGPKKTGFGRRGL